MLSGSNAEWFKCRVVVQVLNSGLNVEWFKC